MSPLDVTVPLDATVQRWAQDLLGGSTSISSLSGGANNHLFLCRGPHSELVIKRYRQQNFGALVSRRDAEVAFLNHASLAAPEFVPMLLAVHDNEDMIAMSVVNGERYPEGRKIPESHIHAAIDFYRQLNNDKVAVRNYPIAAREGYLSISAHLGNVACRIAALSTEHLPNDVRSLAQSALREVRRRFETAEKVLLHSITTGEINDELSPEHVQLSPGDFGFHNALRVGDKPVFIDFEYAGSDDPAKTVADLFLQPKIPIEPTLFDRVVTEAAVVLTPAALSARARLLGRLLSVKWSVIILGPLDAERFPSFCERYGGEMLPELSRRLDHVKRYSLGE